MRQLLADGKAKVCAIILLVICSCLTAACLAGVFVQYSNEQGYITIYQGLLANDLSDFALACRGFIVPMIILAFAACVGLLVFLLYAAGRRRDSEDITLNPLDKTPLDLYAAACFFIAIPMTYLVDAGMNMYWTLGLPLIIVGWSVLTLMAAGLFMTFATRVKIGGWWKNTIIFKFLWKPLKRFCSWVKRTVLQIFDHLPLIWKSLLVFIIFAIFSIIFCVNAAYGSPFAAFLLGLLGLISLLIISIVATQINKLMQAAEKMAAGDLEYRVDTKSMFRVLKQHGSNLNSISEGMALAVDDRLKSEHFKTELITNVSHDLKTPLTSIINYVDLLQKEQIDNAQVQEYLEVLSRQSAKLKKLTEDLMDASKASTGNVQMVLSNMDMNEFVEQIMGEYAGKLQDVPLELITDIPDDHLVIMADGRYLWRVFDNLFNNVCKYAQPHTRVFVDLSATRDKVRISVKNTSRDLLNVSAEELMERFVRGDSSRNSEGSGLGLSIARSLTELQKGEMSLFVDGDLFKAELSFDRVYD